MDIKNYKMTELFVEWNTVLSVFVHFLLDVVIICLESWHDTVPYQQTPICLWSACMWPCNHVFIMRPHPHSAYLLVEHYSQVSARSQSSQKSQCWLAFQPSWSSPAGSTAQISHVSWLPSEVFVTLRWIWGDVLSPAPPRVCSVENAAAEKRSLWPHSLTMPSLGAVCKKKSHFNHIHSSLLYLMLANCCIVLIVLPKSQEYAARGSCS